MQVNRPIGSPITPYVAPQAPVGGSAPQTTSVATTVNTVQPQQAAGAGIMSVLSSLWNGLVGLVKSLFGGLFATKTPAQVPGTTPTDDATLAQQFGLLNTPANVAAFKSTLSAQQAEPNVLGPGVGDPEAITELQQLLAGWGFQVQQTGQFDATTADAVMQFKAANGLTETFQFANGQPGVTPFVDERTRNKMIALLTNGQTPTQPTQPSTGSTTPSDDLTAYAQQYQLSPDAGNVATFKSIVAEQIAQGAIGPGNAPADAIAELQQLLAGWGYPVQQTGQFDQATIDCVISFKRSNGLTDTRFRMGDGLYGITPCIDAATQNVMLAKLNESSTATPTPAPASTSAPATQYQAAGLTAEEQQIAQAQGVLATRENFDAFMKEAQALETQNPIGPGSTDTEAVNELQQLLGSWGYAVQPTGQFDQATIDAVIKFKKDNAITAAYKMADGTPGVHPFIDDTTKAVMIKKLGG